MDVVNCCGKMPSLGSETGTQLVLTEPRNHLRPRLVPASPFRSPMDERVWVLQLYGSSPVARRRPDGSPKGWEVL